jgi:PAS domain S-box-containing protein
MARSIKEDTEELKKKDLYIKSMMDAMWILDPDNIITDVNPSFTKLFGYEHSEAIGLSVFDLLDEENFVIMKYELGNRARKTEFSTYQISLTAKDGRQIPVLITSTPIHEDGEVTAKIGVIKDFSDLADLMSKLVESKKEMSGIALENINLYEKMKELFGQQRRRRIQEQQLLLELAGRISASSDTRQSVRSTIELIRNYLKAGAVWYAFVGDFGHISIGVSDGLDESDLHLFLPEHALSLERAVANSGEYMIVEDISADKRYSVPEVISRHNFRTAVGIPVKVKGSTTGVITLFYRNMTLVKEEDIHFLLIASNMLSVSIEISELYEKRILEKSLAETVFDNISDGVCTIDTEGLVTSANNAFGRMLGIPLENILKKHFSAVIPHDEGPVTGGNNRCPVTKALQGERDIAEMQFIRPDGTELILQVSSSPLLDPKGNIRGAVQVVRDISKEKEIGRLKSDLVRNVSHEFRTPLSAIVGMTEMLLDRDVSGERAVEYLKTMYSEGMRLSHMISDLLDLSIIETGRDRINITRISVTDFMEEIKRTFSHALQTKNASLEFRFEEGIDTVWAEKNRIRQVLINLITNSLTYSERGVKIIISLKKERNFFIIEVKDTGWGIGARDLAHIGEKFFRGSYAHITKGTGLGIALCKEIIRMHGGVLEITSGIPEGTLIMIRIPMRESI